MGNIDTRISYLEGTAGSGKTLSAIREHLDDKTVLVNNEEDYQALKYIARGSNKSEEFSKAIVMNNCDDATQTLSSAINRGRNNGCKTLIWDCNGKLWRNVLSIHTI